MNEISSSRRSSIASEGWPWIIAAVILTLLVYRFAGWAWSLPGGVLTVLLILLFQDPYRRVPPLPLGVLAPVDGRVLEIHKCTDEVLPGAWQRITIRGNPFGAYTVRAPIEGAVLDVREEVRLRGGRPAPSGLWLRSEEQDDVVLFFPRRARRLAPRAFVGYGERIGQGQRFAYLRMAPRAEIYLPVTAEMRVAKGDRVRAGIDLLAELVHG